MHAGGWVVADGPIELVPAVAEVVVQLNVEVANAGHDLACADESENVVLDNLLTNCIRVIWVIVDVLHHLCTQKHGCDNRKTRTLYPACGVLFSRDFFLCLFLCLFLCQQHYEKTAGPICMKFSGKVWSDHGTT